ncbi:2OG-Fe(II) oxygenase [Rudaea sp.]|uniref:2OG-Fe(II) oxygenase n=1 Tax=Rudaea sp. TaxID=2136325 RepID=UPI00321F777C
MSYVFDTARLQRIAEQRAAEFSRAEPYPHIVIDEFLDPAQARLLAEVFPGPDESNWDHYAAPGIEMKLGCGDETRFPAPIRDAVRDLNSSAFVSILEKLTGIDHLLTDPHLLGGGMHLTRQGGLLGIHSDFNWHTRIHAHRRLNLLVYLTPDWRPEYAGELELWDTGGTRLVRRVEPVFNRAVLFATRSDTFHGHPQPWAAPAGVHRQSIALYYYTSERPEAEKRPAHNTLYKGYNA